jgi:hypothetical protein
MLSPSLPTDRLIALLLCGRPPARFLLLLLLLLLLLALTPALLLPLLRLPLRPLLGL